MSQIVQDGTGTGKKLKVDGNNRAHIKSVSIDVDKQATDDGRSYNINTGLITLTNATETPVLYLKNNEDAAIHVFALAVGTYTSTGGSPTDITVTVVRNPTSGTIVSNATAVDISSNRNYGSAETLGADAYKGATGNTMTDGTDHLLLRHSSASRLFATIDEIVPKGASIGVKITPPSGNTSMQCYAALICHLEDVNE